MPMLLVVTEEYLSIFNSSRLAVIRIGYLLIIYSNLAKY